MPIYSYRCPICDLLTTEFREMSDRNRLPACSVCVDVKCERDIGADFSEPQNASTGETLRAPPGESLGGGTVLSIALDGVRFDRDGEVSTIAVGENIEGTAGPAAPGDPGTTGTTTGATSQPAAGEAGSVSDTLLRMLQRREREVNR